MTDVDRYIEELGSCLRVSGRDRTRILVEVRDHLDDAIADRERNGERRDRAVARAFDAFGAPSLLATQLNAAAGTRAMRRAPIVAFVAGLGVLVGFLVAGTTQPHTSVPTNANLATQVSFFLAVLAFQVAVVAGICAASRALAMHREPTVSSDTRQLVHRCALISTGALGVAAIGWATTMGLAFNRLVDPNRVTLVIGGVVMITASGVAIIAMYHLKVNAADDTGYADAASTGRFGLGERCIDVVRRHPVASCLIVGACSAVPAMSHAETTLTGALPWGAIQAASVVAAFVALGPALGLWTPSVRPLGSSTSRRGAR